MSACCRSCSAFHKQSLITSPPLGVQGIAMSVIVCLSVRSHISKTTLRNSRLGHSLSKMEYVVYLRFVYDVTFSHNGPWRGASAVFTRAPYWASSTYSLGVATLFDFLVVYIGSKLRTGTLPLVGGLQRAV